MRIVIEHLRTRTIPHDLVEFMTDIPFYEGCMIVQIHDHKSTAASQATAQVEAGVEKRVPFSVHNYNEHLTPSSYVPFQGNTPEKGKLLESEDAKSKSSEQKDKENMPAPSAPGNGAPAKQSTVPQKPRVTTIVLHPTPLSNHVDLSIKAAESIAMPGGRRDSRTEAGPLSATVPLTPMTAIPPTPQASMAPPAKRLKKTKAGLDSSNIYSAESQIALATCAPLILEPVNNAAESAALLKQLEHPMHSAKPPSPKSRKRTVAEMAADEAFAAEQERYMLIMDERLSSNATNAQGGANPASGDGQAGGFEARFERFKTLENIKTQHEQIKREEKLRAAELERKANQEREREKLRLDALKKDESQNQDKIRNGLAQQQAAANQARSLEMSRRQQMVAQAHAQGQQGMPAQMQNQHSHPQANNIITNGVHAQPQRFHQQQVTQAQASSPIVRNGTPQSHSSPNVNGMGNAPMQHTTSSMGGSPPRPGSVVHQNHPQMVAPGSHVMTAQRSQQSHAGTPRMPSSTPVMQQTPLNRPMNQTPRMSQGSPVQGQMGPSNMPTMPTMNGQMITPQQQLAHQQMMHQRIMQQRNQQAQAMMAGNAQGLTPQQMMQAQMLRQQQQAQQQAQGMVGMGNNAQIPQGYTQHMAAMARQGMQNGMNQQNFMNGAQNVQQMQMQQMQLRQAQVAQAQAQAQHAQAQARQQGQNAMNANVQAQINQRAAQLYAERIQNLQQSNPGGISTEMDNQFKIQCRSDAQQWVLVNIQRRRQHQQQQVMLQQQQMVAAQQNGSQHMNGGMPNGMGMQ
jgi:transcription factor SPT20